MKILQRIKKYFGKEQVPLQNMKRIEDRTETTEEDESNSFIQDDPDIDISQEFYEADRQRNTKTPEIKLQDISNTESFKEARSLVQSVLSSNHAKELSDVIGTPTAEKVMKSLISKYISERKITVKKVESHADLVDILYEDLNDFGFLTKYLYDPNIEEINVNSWEDIELVYGDHWEKAPETFIDAQHCLDQVKEMCRKGGKILDEGIPYVDSEITKGIRISALCAPVVDPEVGAAASIRIVRKNVFEKEQLIQWGTLTGEMFDLILDLLQYGITVAIAGATSSGKTSDMVSYLYALAKMGKRIFMSEDVRETDLIIREDNGKVISRVVHTKTRYSKDPDKNITLQKLVKAALRFDPEFVVPSEVRGAEALDAQEAARTGHVVVLSFHAGTAQSAYSRLGSLAMMSETNIPYEHLMKLIVEAFPIMVFKERLPDGSRKYMSIIEATGYKEGEVQYNELYRFIPTRTEKTEDGHRVKKIHGYFKKEHNISSDLAFRMMKAGADLEVIRKYAGKEWNPE